MKKLVRDFLKFKRESKLYKTNPSSNYWQYYKRWKNTLDNSKTSLHYKLPWINFQAIAFLENELKPKQKIVEFGGGGSTLFFLTKGCEVTTIEHDEKWFKEISSAIEKDGFLKQWQGFLIPPQVNSSSRMLNPAEPLDYCTSSSDFADTTFINYASKIDCQEDASLDVVLIDGRSRPSCIYHAIPKIKKGGCLIIDNTEREYYSDYFLKNFADQFTLILDSYGPVPYIGWFNKTSIWRKK